MIEFFFIYVYNGHTNELKIDNDEDFALEFFDWLLRQKIDFTMDILETEVSENVGVPVLH